MKKQLATLATVVLSAASVFGMKLGTPAIGNCRAKAPTYITIPLLDNDGVTTNALSSVVFDGDARPYIVLGVDYPHGSSEGRHIEERAVFYDINNGVMRFSRTFSTNDTGLAFFVQQGYLNLNGSEFYYTSDGGAETQMAHGLVVRQSPEVTVQEGIDDTDLQLYNKGVLPTFTNMSGDQATVIKIANNYDGAKFYYFDPSTGEFDPQELPSSGYSLPSGGSVCIWLNRSTPLSSWNPSYRSGYTSNLRRFTSSNSAAELNVSGDLYYLLRSPNLGSGAFAEMFSEMASLTGTEGLEVLADETVASYDSNAQNVYAGMFRGSGVTNTLDFGALQGVVNGFGGACERMYYNCKSLKSASPMNIDSISGPGLFKEAFTGCTALDTVAGIRIPSSYSKSAAANTFYNTFKDCTSLAGVGNSIPILDAQYAQYCMFNNSGITEASLTVASSIDSAYCMLSMFDDCHSLVSVSVSRDFNVAGERAADNMFMDCTSLVSAFPGRSITSTGDRSASSMFGNCSALKTAPPVTLRNSSTYGCYNMFSNSGVTNATVSLPSGIPKGGCVQMFTGCASLRSAVLSQSGTVTVGEYGLEGMFRDCSSLSSVSLPKLGNIGKWGCYGMFFGCTSLREVPFSSWSGTVGEFGLYGMFGRSGIEYIDGLTFEASTESQGDNAFSDMFYDCQNLTDVSNFKMLNVWDSSGMFEDCRNLVSISNCEFSVYGPQLRPMWTNLVEIYDTKITVSSSTYTNSCEYFFIDNNDLSLVNGLTLDPGGSVGAFHHMFTRCCSLETVENLVLPKTLPARTCESMFEGCSGLKSLSGAYIEKPQEKALLNMFRDSGLETVDGLVLNNPQRKCCEGMFSGCDSLVAVSNVVVSGVEVAIGHSELTSAPCHEMFYACTNIAEVCGFSFGIRPSPYASGEFGDVGYGVFSGCRIGCVSAFTNGVVMKTSASPFYGTDVRVLSGLSYTGDSYGAAKQLMQSLKTSLEEFSDSAFTICDASDAGLLGDMPALRLVSDVEIRDEYNSDSGEFAWVSPTYARFFATNVNLVAVSNVVLKGNDRGKYNDCMRLFHNCPNLRSISGLSLPQQRYLNHEPVDQRDNWRWSFQDAFTGCDAIAEIVDSKFPFSSGKNFYDSGILQGHGYVVNTNTVGLFAGMPALSRLSGDEFAFDYDGADLNGVHAFDDLFAQCSNLVSVTGCTFDGMNGSKDAFRDCPVAEFSDIAFTNALPGTMFSGSQTFTSLAGLSFRGTSGSGSPLLGVGGSITNIDGLVVANGVCPSFTGFSNLETVSGLDMSGRLSCPGMFEGCTSLTQVGGVIHESPSCFASNMFFGCSSLVHGPAIDVDCVETNGFYYAFNGCTSLESIPALNLGYVRHRGCVQMFSGIKTLVSVGEPVFGGGEDFAYYYMFHGCESLAGDLRISASQLGAYAYKLAFYKTGVTSASITVGDGDELADVPEQAFYNAFSFCPSLTNATVNAGDVYSSGFNLAFSSCSNLVFASVELGDLSTDSCAYMFQNCTGMDTIGAFKVGVATNFSFRYTFKNCGVRHLKGFEAKGMEQSYWLWENTFEDGMPLFTSCTNLVDVEGFRVTNAKTCALFSAFAGLSSLTTVSGLDVSGEPSAAAALFRNCANLSSVSVLFGEWPQALPVGTSSSELSLGGWLYGGSANGVFTCPESLRDALSEMPRNASTVPGTWTVEIP